MQTQGNRANAWRMILAATLLVAITLGARNTLGLFLSPINTATGLGLASISLAWALSQLVWGACQPLAEIDFSSAEDMGQHSMFGEECEGMCGV